MMTPTSSRAPQLCVLFLLQIFSTLVQGQFYKQMPQGYFYNDNNLRADIAVLKRDIRLANADFKATGKEVVQQLSSDAYMKEYNDYKERGSKFMADGVTPIPENDTIDISEDDKIPGFGDKLWEDVHIDMMQEDTVPPSVLEAYQLVPMETVDSGWVIIVSTGDLYTSNQQTNNFGTLFNSSPNKIIRVACQSCDSTHREVYYKRLTTAPSDLLTIITTDWRSTNNAFNIDFKLYSTYEDALQNTNAWTYCGGFDISGQGFPGTCGPTGESVDQWMNTNIGHLGQPDVAILVENSSISNEDRKLSSIEAQLEAQYQMNPDQAFDRDNCWNLQFRDKRVACWRACQHGAFGNLGALKLCNNLRYEGLIWKGRKNAERLEVSDEDGTELGKYVKPTHALGSDSGLPSLGTY